MNMIRVLSRREAQNYVGGRENLDRLEAAGLVQGFKGKSQIRDFCIKQLDHAVDVVMMKGWDALEEEHKK